MNKEKKTGNIAATIIGIIVFIAVYIITSQINRNNAIAAAKAAAMGQQYVASPLVSGSNGILSQIQVLATVIMVLFDRKRGFIVALILEIGSGLMTLIGQLIIAKNLSAAPAIAITIVTIVTLVILYLNIERNHRMHDEINRSYEQLIEQNRMIEEKDQTLTYLAYYDRMTGLPNRAYFSDKIQEYIDNSIHLAVKRDDGSVFFEKTFVKGSFHSYVEESFRRNGQLASIRLDEAEGPELHFSVVIGLPDAIDDVFVPLQLTINNLGGISIRQDDDMGMLDYDDEADGAENEE